MKRRNKFSLSHYVLGTCKMGYMLPIGLTEVLPGDTIQQATSVFMRLAPMLAPVMHPVQVKIHHWYVPLRLVFPKFEDFITGGPDGLDTTEFPTITSDETDGFLEGSLADHLGLPPGIPGLTVSALPFRAYNLIYNEWYRDQDLEQEIAISDEPGADTTTSIELLRGDWERDYFTTARPWPQKGIDVTVPVQASGTADVNIDITGNGTPSFSKVSGFASGALQTNSSDTIVTFGASSSGVSGPTSLAWLNPALQASGTVTGLDVGSVNINDLREAFALQRFEEHRAMYGSRYVEYLRYLGIKASDARLQRPEYLGGGKQTIQFSEVLQTAADGDNPVGTLRGHGIAAMRSNRYRRFIEEHGYIISIMLIRPKSIYQQGVPRTWLRRVKEDFWQQELQHIGQQEVLTQELFGAAEPEKVFGYQNRYDDYRQHVSYVAGEFRSILNYWHLAREFGNEPVLNADFISSVPTERIFAAQENDQIYYMANHSIQARRLMAKYGNPI
ncbi:major capsid protein [Alces alces faeces associated microvirus MP21 4718]|uniref:major capsid protein n=1 Tax=Alces alces faeces associated microvirus MP21 4718 TaxID=2219138 RepID=UPI000DF0AE86|nr:major capsid protein [Alces alces faeces associated microvirus MP21 4718]AXB22587.1 major capsid protein [Alces alces faeces associated microvirus MP21 4718]